MAGIYIPNLSEDKFNQICKSAGLEFVYVAVPDHGRLVDGDKLYAKCDDPYWCVWRSEIEDEPMVIPADRGDVNGPDTSE